MSETPQPSDQRPEEAPAEQVPEDSSRDDRDESPGVPGEEETGTGNPDAAGAEDPDAPEGGQAGT